MARASRTVDLSEEREILEAALPEVPLIGLRVETEIESALEHMLQAIERKGLTSIQIEEIRKVVYEFKDIWLSISGIKCWFVDRFRGLGLPPIVSR